MKKIIYKFLFFASVIGTLVSCQVEEFSDLNNPEVDAFSENLTRGDLQDLIGGVLYSSRTRLGTYLDDCGVVGREYWRFSSSDPRFTTDLLGGDNSVLDNNTFYITGPWASRYRTVKNANLILGFLDAQEGAGIFSSTEINAARGFLKTTIAHELLLNLNLTDVNGIRVDVADENNLGPFVSKAEALTAIRGMLVDGASNLANGAGDFPFDLPSGFDGFNTAGTFLLANKALSARVAAYQGDASATLAFLSDSFFDLNGSNATGLYYNFAEDANDILNPMFFPVEATTAGARIMVPGFLADGEAGDSRLDKVQQRSGPLTLDGLEGDFAVFIYDNNTAPIAVIRNEELKLLYAEANITVNPTEAVNALSVVRVDAGLLPYTGAPTPAALTDEMLKQRRYSLYAEGHRWVDMRRYNRLDQLPLARPADDVWSSFPVPLTENQ